MKTLSLLLILLAPVAASAQTAKAPATLEVTPTMIMAINTSTQEIIAVVIRSPRAGGGGWSGVISHDFYFKHGITPTEAIAVDAHDDGRTYTSAELLFVQFADGSIWGDSKLAVDLLAQRKPQKAFLERVLLAYQSQGEQAFVDQLQQEKQFLGLTARLLGVQRQAGTQAAVDVVKERLAAADSRRF